MRQLVARLGITLLDVLAEIMADFPSLVPSSRIYTYGAVTAMSSTVLTGQQVSVRRSNAATGHTLALEFISSSVADQSSIFTHYASHNRFYLFDLPAVVLTGSGLTFPAGYQWIYAKPPSVSYLPDVVTVSVELELVPPNSI